MSSSDTVNSETNLQQKFPMNTVFTIDITELGYPCTSSIFENEPRGRFPLEALRKYEPIDMSCGTEI